MQGNGSRDQSRILKYKMDLFKSTISLYLSNIKYNVFFMKKARKKESNEVVREEYFIILNGVFFFGVCLSSDIQRIYVTIFSFDIN